MQTKERRNLIGLINEIKKEKKISIDGQYEKKKEDWKSKRKLSEKNDDTNVK